jgi:hypothetical protein
MAVAHNSKYNQHRRMIKQKIRISFHIGRKHHHQIKLAIKLKLYFIPSWYNQKLSEILIIHQQDQVLINQLLILTIILKNLNLLLLNQYLNQNKNPNLNPAQKLHHPILLQMVIFNRQNV